MYRLIYTVARGFPSLLDHSQGCRLDLDQWLDCVLWCSLHDCYRPRTSIRIQSLECTHATPGIKTCMDNSLPPSIERHGGTFSPLAKSCFESSTEPLCVDGFTTAGTAGNSDSSKGRHSLYSSRDGVWYHSSPPQRIFHLILLPLIQLMMSRGSKLTCSRFDRPNRDLHTETAM